MTDDLLRYVEAVRDLPDDAKLGWPELRLITAPMLGEPGQDEQPEPILLPPDKLEPAPPRIISPLLCDSRTMWFGAQGAGKSLLVSFAIAALAEGDSAFIPGTSVASPMRVGILDWEDNQDEWAERLFRVGVPGRSVPYLAPRGPLTNPSVLASVRSWIDSDGVDLVAIDSVIPAAGGADAMKPEGPTAYYQALRAFERPTLSLAHVPKSQGQADQPFGSTYWSTPSRLTWRIEKIESSEHILKLVNPKHSRWPQAAEMLLKVGWSEPGPLRLRSALSLTLERDAAPLIDRIVLALGVAGTGLTIEDLAGRTGGTTDSVYSALKRNPGRAVCDGNRPAHYSPAGGAR
jgi:hypothetical protein